MLVVLVQVHLNMDLVLEEALVVLVEMVQHLVQVELVAQVSQQKYQVQL